MRDNANGYDASQITVLEGLEAIRKRPGMYVGSTSERGLHNAVFEVMGWAVNEVLGGRASAVDVTLTPDGGVKVAVDGPGAPVEAAGDTDGPTLEALLTRMHAEPRPGRDAAHVGFAGIGPCVTNALSSHLTAEVRRDGVRWLQEYAHGVALAPPTAVGPTAGSGTTLTFQPDSEIFDTAACSFAVLADRFRELAFLNRSLEISLVDTRSPGRPRSERFHFPGGARDLVAFLDTSTRTPVHPDTVAYEWEDPRIEGTAEVALRWCASDEDLVRSFANSRPTPHGGTHVEGLREGAAAALNAHARALGLLTATEPDLGTDQIVVGLTAVVSVKLANPQFEGATKWTLGNSAVRAGVREGVQEHLGRWLEEHPDQAAAVVGRIGRGARREVSGGADDEVAGA